MLLDSCKPFLWEYSCFQLCYSHGGIWRKKLSLVHVNSSPKLSQLSCDPSKLQLMGSAQHAWDLHGLQWLLTCSTLEIAAKELLKMSSPCYCLLHPKALGSQRGCWSSHPVEAQLALGHTSAVMPLHYSHWSCPIQNNNSL